MQCNDSTATFLGNTEHDIMRKYSIIIPNNAKDLERFGIFDFTIKVTHQRVSGLIRAIAGKNASGRFHVMRTDSPVSESVVRRIARQYAMIK